MTKQMYIERKKTFRSIAGILGLSIVVVCIICEYMFADYHTLHWYHSYNKNSKREFPRCCWVGGRSEERAVLRRLYVGKRRVCKYRERPWRWAPKLGRDFFIYLCWRHCLVFSHSLLFFYYNISYLSFPYFSHYRRIVWNLIFFEHFESEHKFFLDKNVNHIF